MALDLGHDAVNVFLHHVDDGDLGPLPHEVLGHRLANALATAGDEGHAVLDVHESILVDVSN
jgi:hypothetical protein